MSAEKSEVWSLGRTAVRDEDDGLAHEQASRAVEEGTEYQRFLRFFSSDQLRKELREEAGKTHDVLVQGAKHIVEEISFRS